VQPGARDRYPRSSAASATPNPSGNASQYDLLADVPGILIIDFPQDTEDLTIPNEWDTAPGKHQRSAYPTLDDSVAHTPHLISRNTQILQQIPTDLQVLNLTDAIG
jgi:hypothetical protein